MRFWIRRIVGAIRLFEQGASLCFPYRKTWPLRAKLAIAPAGRNGPAPAIVQLIKCDEDMKRKMKKKNGRPALDEMRRRGYQVKATLNRQEGRASGTSGPTRPPAQGLHPHRCSYPRSGPPYSFFIWLPSLPQQLRLLGQPGIQCRQSGGSSQSWNVLSIRAGQFRR